MLSAFEQLIRASASAFVRGSSVTWLSASESPEFLSSECLENNESGNETSVSVDSWLGGRSIANGKLVNGLRCSMKEFTHE